MIKDLVIFDVDNTIINGQSQQLFLNFLHEKKYVSLFYYVRITIWFILYKLGIVKNPKVTMEYAFYFIKDKTVEDIEVLTDSFFNSVLKNKIYPDVLKIIKKHQEQDQEIILISNAADVIIKKLADYLHIKNFLSTKLEVTNNRYTGNIIGDIMYGSNKCKALKNYVQSKNLVFENSWSYADHDSDIPLFLETSHPCVVNPSKKLKKIAVIKKWPVLNFKL